MIVETALTMLIVLTLMFGVISFGWALFIYNSISNGAREGARYAIVNGSTSTSPATAASIKQVILGRAPGLDTNSLTLGANPWPSGNSPGNPVTVTLTYTYNFPFSMIPLPTVTLSSTSKMIILQ